MVISSKIKVVARCKVFDINDFAGEDEGYKEDIELFLTKEDCENFLFRFSPIAFSLNGYKVMAKYSPEYKLQAICLYKLNKGYIITNLNQVITDILEGYNRLNILERISDIMEFDFKAGIDIQDNYGVKDEFDEEE